MRYLFSFLVVISLIVSSVAKAQLLTLDSRKLESNKAMIQQGNKAVSSALDNLVKQADELIGQPNYSVTEKEHLPDSKDRHDYLSRGTYWWPNPDSPNGLPYIAKDGVPNPERLEIKDLSYLILVSQNTNVLGLAYYYTKDERYVDRAVSLLSHWFLNPKTRMNPNLNHSQAIPGVVSGRPEGIIDTRYFVDLLDGVQLLHRSEHFPEDVYQGIVQWFSNYLDWMLHSDIGKRAYQQENNIGTSYFAQALAYAKFTGNDQVAEQLLKGRIPELIAVQFETDGRQPQELKRTNSWNYSIANLSYWFRMSKLAEDYGIDLWNYTTANNRSIRNGYRYLEQYADGRAEWQYQQRNDIDKASSFYRLRRQGAEKYNKPTFFLFRIFEGGKSTGSSPKVDTGKIDPVAILSLGID